MIIAGHQNGDSLTRLESTPDRNKSCEEMEMLSPKVIYSTNKDYIKERDGEMSVQIGSGEISKKAGSKNIKPNAFVNVNRAAQIYDPVQRVALPRKNLTSFDRKDLVDSGNETPELMFHSQKQTSSTRTGGTKRRKQWDNDTQVIPRPVRKANKKLQNDDKQEQKPNLPSA